jgi:glutamate racemase
MNQQPIGVFDSGLGGLTAVKELQRILPNEDIVYFGDTGRVPYGNRSRETIQRYAEQDVAFLLEKHVKMVIAACGTVSSVANAPANLPIPFTGVVAPTAEAAAKATRNKRVGVIGTTATIRSGSYRTALRKIDASIEVFERDCPLFVPLVENGWISPEETVTKLVVERYLTPLKQAGIDTLILGCTHYPLLRPFLLETLNGGVTLIDSGRETALFAANELRKLDLCNQPNRQGSSLFYVSDSTEGFQQIAEIFLGCSIQHHVGRIDIERY